MGGRNQYPAGHLAAYRFHRVIHHASFTPTINRGSSNKRSRFKTIRRSVVTPCEYGKWSIGVISLRGILSTPLTLCASNPNRKPLACVIITSVGGVCDSGLPVFNK